MAIGRQNYTGTYGAGVESDAIMSQNASRTKIYLKASSGDFGFRFGTSTSGVTALDETELILLEGEEIFLDNNSVFDIRAAIYLFTTAGGTMVAQAEQMAA